MKTSQSNKKKKLNPMNNLRCNNRKSNQYYHFYIQNIPVALISTNDCLLSRMFLI